MRVLAHLPKYPPAQNAGAEWYAHTLFRWLVERGHEVSVYINDSFDPFELDGVHVEGRRGVGRLDELYEFADVIVTHLDETRGACALARRHHLPVVHLIHNDDQVAHDELTSADVALLVPNSEWIDRTLTGWPNRCILRPPVFAADYATSTGDHVTLLNLSAAKGAAVFYALALRFPAVPFLGVRGAWGDQIIPAELPANVEVVDNTPDVVDVYARTRVLLVPSSYESWGRVAIEAAASGIPVLAHPTPGLVEALGSAGIFVDRDDLDAWERTLRRYLTNADAWEAASEIHRLRAFELDPTVELERLESKLAQLVGEWGGDGRMASATPIPR